MDLALLILEVFPHLNNSMILCMSLFKVTWSIRRMSKGGDVCPDNAEDQNQCLVLALYAILFGDKGVWRDY